MCVTLVRPCTKIYVRTMGFLLGIRRLEDFVKIRRFPIVKWLCFETRSDVLKSMISQS